MEVVPATREKAMSAKTKGPRVAIVTGASSGIGLGITEALLEQGLSCRRKFPHDQQIKGLESPQRTSFWWTVTSAKRR